MQIQTILQVSINEQALLLGTEMMTDFHVEDGDREGALILARLGKWQDEDLHVAATEK